MGRRGRLPGFGENRRNERIYIRVTSREKAMLEDFAKFDEISVSQVIRNALVEKYGDIFESGDGEMM